MKARLLITGMWLVIGMGWLAPTAVRADDYCSADGEPSCSIGCRDTIDPDTGDIIHRALAWCQNGGHTVYNSDGSVLTFGYPASCGCN